MADYKKMYHKTFNALTDTSKSLTEANSIILDANNLLVDMRSRLWYAERLIAKAQEECEDMYINEKEDKPAERS